MGSTDTSVERTGGDDVDSRGTPQMGDQLPVEGGLCDRPWKRRRILRGEGEVVRGEGELSRQEGGREIEFPPCNSAHAFEEETCRLNCSDESLSEEEDADGSSDDADCWRVAFRSYEVEGWTPAQWHAYWRDRGFFCGENTRDLLSLF